MSRVTTRVTGPKPSRDLGTVIEAASRSAARDMANDIVKQARTLAPVRTGKLKRSIGAKKIRDGVWRVEVGAYYGVYVEYGTRYMHAQPYLRPAIMIAKRNAARTVKKNIAKEKRL